MKEKRTRKISCQGLATFATRAVLALGALFMAFLCVNSMFSTGRLEPGGSEVVSYTSDHVLRMAILAVLAVGGLWALRHTIEKIPTRVLGRIVMLYFLAVSLILVFGGRCYPVADQGSVMDLAARWSAGDYSFLQEDYIHLYPHQLGLAAYMALQALLVGANQYLFFQLLNCFWLAGMVWALYRTAELLFENRLLTNTVLLAMVPCAPLAFYCAFTYGEISSLALGAFAVFFQLRALKQSRAIFFLPSALCIGAAVLLRKNTIILLIVMALVQLVYALCQKQVKTAVWVLAPVAAVFVGQYGIRALCNTNGTYTVPQGAPTSTWIVMGMQEEDTLCGAFNGYTIHISRDTGGDRALMQADAQKQIAQEWAKMTADPSYMAHFYYCKLMQQWNEPTLNMFVMTHSTEGRPVWLENLWSGSGYGILYALLNYDQFLLYLFALAEMLVQLRRPSTLKMTFTLFFVGGFLFSILWEAKARYILSYYAFLLPLAGAGLYHTMRAAQAGWQRLKARRASAAPKMAQPKADT